MCYPHRKGRERVAVPVAWRRGSPGIRIGPAGVLDNNNQGMH